MTRSAVAVYQFLVFAEPILMIGALAMYLRLDARTRVSAMRDYLIARMAQTLFVVFMLHSQHGRMWGAASWAWVYFFGYWTSDLILTFLVIRTAAAVLREILDPLAGLQTVFDVAYRWLIAATLLLAFSTVGYLLVNPGRPSSVFWRLSQVYPTVQVVPVVFVMAAGFWRGLPRSSRLFAILLGLALEPACSLLTPWPWKRSTSLVSMGNLVHEIASCGVLALWCVFFLLPDCRKQLRSASAGMLRLDEMARMAMRQRRSAARTPSLVQKGAQPWPKYRRDI